MTEYHTYNQLNFYKEGRFYIFGDIDETIPCSIIQPLTDELDRRCNQKVPDPVEIYISSPGGDLCYCFDIIALFDVAAQNNIPINTYVFSYAASAASMIAVCGHNRFVSSRAYHLLHFARLWNFAHNPEMLKNNFKNAKFLQKELIKVYETKTKLKDIEQKLLSDNYTIDGGTALVKAGLADYIV